MRGNVGTASSWHGRAGAPARLVRPDRQHMEMRAVLTAAHDVMSTAKII
ncbi:hypothetical protein [Lentzea atacamensis]|nr:hypothetical protein [Lentzea atacamensis]